MVVRRWTDPATLRDRLEAENVTSEVTFSTELLRQADGERLIYDGERIVLNVDNGRWVWEVTGRDDLAGLVYGRWPTDER